MVGPIEQLMGVLDLFSVQYTRLLSVLRQEQEAARQWNAAAMSDATAEKEVLLANIESLERRRSALTKEICTQLKMPRGNPTLSVLARNLAEPWRGRLGQKGEALKELIRSVRKANEESRLTVSHALALVRSSLSCWEHFKGMSNSYSSTGRIYGGGRGGRFVSGAI